MTPGDAPNPPFGDPKSIVAEKNVFNDFGGTPKEGQRDPKWIILGAKRRHKTHQDIVRISVSIFF